MTQAHSTPETSISEYGIDADGYHHTFVRRGPLTIHVESGFNTYTLGLKHFPGQRSTVDLSHHLAVLPERTLETVTAVAVALIEGRAAASANRERVIA